jgi:heme-degrading monooxygenase HmoA
MQLREMDEQTTYRQQLEQDNGPVVLINQFTVAPEGAQHFLEVWADDAAFMKQQPGFVSTQLHRGTAGSTTFINLAVWESAAALGAAFRSPAPSSNRASPDIPRAPSRRNTSSRRSASLGSVWHRRDQHPQHSTDHRRPSCDPDAKAGAAGGPQARRRLMLGHSPVNVILAVP